MHLYCAAVYTNNYKPGMQRYRKLDDNEKEKVVNVPHILESYHYVEKQQFVNAMRADGAKVFLDSGAFSAWTLGTTIDLVGYCDYIKKNQDILRVEGNDIMASVLDGIGDPQETYENQMKMEQQGVRPLPCFHYGEDERYLEWYVERYDYITIGGMVGKPVQQLIIWLDRIWQKYMLKDGKPKLKVHAFGITSVPVMQRYPWFSCDSSSWIQAAAFGSIVLPGIAEGREAMPINVSAESPNRHKWGAHLSTLSPIERERIIKIIEDNGFNEERLATAYESRAVFNLFAYCELNKIINAKEKDTIKTVELF